METRQEVEKKEQQEQQIQQEAPAITPGRLRVIKRNGSVVPYDEEKISIAITKAFLAVEGGKQKTSLWHFAQVPHEYIFDSVEEILNELEEIDKGEKYPDSSRWRLLLKDKR